MHDLGIGVGREPKESPGRVDALGIDHQLLDAPNLSGNGGIPAWLASIQVKAFHRCDGMHDGIRLIDGTTAVIKDPDGEILDMLYLRTFEVLHHGLRNDQLSR